MTVPTKFRKQGGRTIGSFSVIDIATGKGYGRFFGAASSKNGSYHITQNIIDSGNNHTIVGTSTEINFDLNFEKAAIIEGITFVSFSNNQDTGAGNYGSTVRLLHVDSGAVETQLGELSGGQLSNAGSSLRNQLAFDVTKQLFKKNEKLRVEWRGVVQSGAGRVYHDPSNREKTENTDPTSVGTAATQDTTFIVDIPFKIEN